MTIPTRNSAAPIDSCFVTTVAIVPRFIAVEMLMCVATGVLEGVQSGGNCFGMLVALVLLLLLYTVALICVRPYNALITEVSQITISVLQIAAAACMVVHAATSSRSAPRRSSGDLARAVVFAAP